MYESQMPSGYQAIPGYENDSWLVKKAQKKHNISVTVQQNSHGYHCKEIKIYSNWFKTYEGFGTTSGLKGIISDLNNILWHESEGRKKNHKFNFDPNLTFSSYAQLLCFIAFIDYCVK